MPHNCVCVQHTLCVQPVTWEFHWLKVHRGTALLQFCSVLHLPSQPPPVTFWVQHFRRAGVARPRSSPDYYIIVFVINTGFIHRMDIRKVLFRNMVVMGIGRIMLSAGFKPARGDPNGFLVHCRNHSATTTLKLRTSNTLTYYDRCISVFLTLLSVTGSSFTLSPPISIGYISTALRLRHASGAGTFHFS